MKNSIIKNVETSISDGSCKGIWLPILLTLYVSIYPQNIIKIKAELWLYKLIV